MILEKDLGGEHLDPASFHSVLEAYANRGWKAEEGGKDLVVVDVRNRKEIEFGSLNTARPLIRKCFRNGSKSSLRRI